MTKKKRLSLTLAVALGAVSIATAAYAQRDGSECGFPTYEEYLSWGMDEATAAQLAEADYRDCQAGNTVGSGDGGGGGGDNDGGGGGN